MRIICTLDAHQKVAPMRIKTGGDAHRDGKPSRWFSKSIVLVLQNHRVGFPFRCRFKPVPFRIITRPLRITARFARIGNAFCWLSSALLFGLSCQDEQD